MKLNELNLSHVLGDYGAAAVKQVGNRLTGNAEGNLSVKDKIAKDKFIADFIGRASTNLNSAIQSGLVDPKMKSAPQTAVASPNAKAKPTLNQQPTTTVQPNTTQQPTQATGAPKTPAEIQKQKLAAAAQTAQGQMASSPAPSGSGGVQGIKSNVDVNKLQKFNGIVDVSPKIQPAPQVKDAKGRTWTKLPGGWTMDGSKRELDRQDSTYQAFDDAWRVANGAQPSNAGVATGQPQQAPAQQPAAPTQQAPAQQTKMTPQQVAALKGKLKAGAAPTSGQSGFKNYVGGSGERMTGVDKSGAPVFQKIQRESTYSKLDYILESIINVGEAKAAQSISEYLQNMFNQYLKVPITDPKVKAQVKKLADMAQASYPKMTNALTQLANLGFASSYSQGSGVTQGAGATASQPQSALGSFTSGFKQGATGTSTATSTPTTAPTSASAPAQGGSTYEQIMALVSKLTSEEKKQLIATLQEPASGGAGAFDQMGKQLQQPKTTANPVNRQQKLNTNKVKAGNKGAPTPDEQSKFDNLVKQQLAKQA